MNSALGYLVSFVVALGVLITVHEFGHFWVARRLGVKVLRFSVGFGRPLWSRRSRDGETEYVIGAIPLGGYVKMLGEDEGEIPPGERERAFSAKSPWARMAIAVAGPGFNFLFAVLAFWAMYTLGVPGIKPVVGEVLDGTPAAHAGLRPEDRILAVNGTATPTWDAVRTALLKATLGDRPVLMEVQDPDGKVRSLQLDMGTVADPAESQDLLGSVGIVPWQPPPVAGEVVPGGAAARAGLQPGDRVLSLDGEPVATWVDWVRYVRAHPGETIDVEVERAGRVLHLELRPDVREEGDERIGVVGVHIPELYLERLSAVQRYGVLGALGVGIERTWDMSVLMLEVLGRMVVGEASLKNISGPLTIAQYAGESAALGLVPFLSFLAVVSISLGVLNLLPVPILDGGHVLFCLVEVVRGRPVSEAARLAAQRIGILLLLALMSLAFYNDFARLLG